MGNKILTHGIKFKDKIGYAMGDMGGLLTFSLVGVFQNKFLAKRQNGSRSL